MWTTTLQNFAPHLYLYFYFSCICISCFTKVDLTQSNRWCTKFRYLMKIITLPSSISHEIAFQDWINHFQAGDDAKSCFDLNFRNFHNFPTPPASCNSLRLWMPKKSSKYCFQRLELLKSRKIIFIFGWYQKKMSESEWFFNLTIYHQCTILRPWTWGQISERFVWPANVIWRFIVLVSFGKSLNGVLKKWHTDTKRWRRSKTTSTSPATSNMMRRKFLSLQFGFV